MSDGEDLEFNPPPGWDVEGSGWMPPFGWTPPPAWVPIAGWPAAPAGWQFWVSPRVESAASEAGIERVDSTPSEVAGLRGRVRELEAEVARLSAMRVGESDVVELDDERILQEVGIYRYHHPLENAASYKERLADLTLQIKEMAKKGIAILASDLFTYNNSLGKGRKMTAEFSKLMLRAYNAEADNCVRSLRAGNVVTARKRLESTVAAVARLGSMMEMQVNPDYHRLRLRELELTADYLMKVQEEKEAAREERARLREEAKAQAELAAERVRLDKERAHYLNALESLRASTDGDDVAIGEMSQRLEAIDLAIEQNDFRAANIRAGYVYVISNVGAFGPGMVKIGLTRRLEPMERVRELGGASVPFPFDVHALFFAEDAVSVETQLHHAFSRARVNQANQRKEFFFATPEEVRVVLLEKVGNLLEFVDRPDATQYLQSRHYWPNPVPKTD